MYPGRGPSGLLRRDNSVTLLLSIQVISRIDHELGIVYDKSIEALYTQRVRQSDSILSHEPVG